MSLSSVQGTIIYRTWDDAGLSETGVVCSTLEEVLAHCLGVTESRHIERLMLTGPDAHGIARTVTFIFQTITAGDQTS